jgi:hypothetical protein
MVGIWLDNPKNPPSSNPYTNASGIGGDPSYIRGYAILASYHPYAVINSGGITSPIFGIGLMAGGSATNQSGGNISASLTA